MKKLQDAPDAPDISQLAAGEFEDFEPQASAPEEGLLSRFGKHAGAFATNLAAGLEDLRRGPARGPEGENIQIPNLLNLNNPTPEQIKSGGAQLFGQEYMEGKGPGTRALQSIAQNAPTNLATTGPLGTAISSGGKAARALAEYAHEAYTKGQELPGTIGKGIEVASDLAAGGIFLAKDLLKAGKWVKDQLKFWKSPQDFYNYSRLLYEQSNPFQKVRDTLSSTYKNIKAPTQATSEVPAIGRAAQQEAFSGQDLNLGLEKVGSDLVESGLNNASEVMGASKATLANEMKDVVTSSDNVIKAADDIAQWSESGLSLSLDEKRAARELAQKLYDSVNRHTTTTGGNLPVSEVSELLDNLNTFQKSLPEGSVLNSEIKKVRDALKLTMNEAAAANPQYSKAINDLQSGKDVFRVNYITEGKDAGLMTEGTIKQLNDFKAKNPQMAETIDTILDGNKIKSLTKRIPNKGRASIHVENELNTLADKYPEAKKLQNQYLNSQERAALSANETTALRNKYKNEKSLEKAQFHAEKQKYKQLQQNKKELEKVSKILGSKDPVDFTDSDIADLVDFGKSFPEFKQDIDTTVSAANAQRGYKQLIPDKKAKRGEIKTATQLGHRAIESVLEGLATPYRHQAQIEALQGSKLAGEQAGSYFKGKSTLGNLLGR